MTIQLKEVLTHHDLKKFIEFPFSLYRGNKYWVPPLVSDEYKSLDPTRNPASSFCESRSWLALRQGEVVGRITAILNHRHVEKWGQRYMRFGWVDFVDDAEVSSSLLGAVESWAREKGMEAVHGPLGFTNLDHAGMLIEGFDELSTMATTYNFPWYPRHLEQLSYKKHVDWVEYELAITPQPNENIARIADISRRRYHLHLLETKSKKVLLPYARELFQLYNQEYRNLYSAVPLDDDQVEHAIRQYFGLDFTEVYPRRSGRTGSYGCLWDCHAFPFPGTSACPWSPVSLWIRPFA